ncbi:MAG TPA: hypothetical protein VM553_00245 [Dongiaceae bacterium]|nr:hypothetical protein [Dongiaceae bacterium]
MSRLILWTLLLALTGCKHSVEMTFDLTGDGNFYANGFPTDLRVTADGHLDLRGFHRMNHPMTRRYVTTIEQQIQGYTLSMPIYLPFTAAFDMTRLPSRDVDFLADDAPVQLVNIDPDSSAYGQRQPISVTQTWQPDRYRPHHLLQILPTLGLNLLPNTRYAVLVNDNMPLHEGGELHQHAVLAQLLNDAPPSTVIAASNLQRAYRMFAPLRNYLAAQSIDPGRIVGATIWTTGDPTAQLFAAANVVAQWPAPAVHGLRRVAQFQDYCVLQGSIEIPGFQRGALPYFYPGNGGDIEWDDSADSENSGAPKVQYWRHAPLMITVPRQPMPNAGFPLLLYNHGTGGTAAEVYQRGAINAAGEQDQQGGPARVAAIHGWASASMGGHLGSEHLQGPLEVDGYIAYNFFNPVAWRGNLQQMALERVILRRGLNALQLDPNLCPDATNAASDPLHFDSDMQAVMGQSLGSYIGGIQAAIDPDPYQALIQSGAGGSWIEFVFGPVDPIPLQQVVEAAALQFTPIEHLDRFHPILMLAEMLVGSANNILYTDHLLRKPTKKPPHILVIEGHGDRQVPENIQRPLLLSLGVEPVGDDVGSSEKDSVFWYLQEQGAQTWAFPVAENRQVEGYGSRTAVVVRYEPDGTPGQDGHHVAFQLDAPKHQYGCLLQNLSEGRAPVIMQGGSEADPCL